MADDEPMQVHEVLKGIEAALGLQQRSALEMTMLAGALTGIEWHPVAATLWSYAVEELEDARRLVEKAVALGGRVPSPAPAPFEVSEDSAEAISTLVDHERETLAALHALIPLTGQQPRSEALEHRLEHQIMRKQEQVDTLHRLLRKREVDDSGD